MKEKIKKIKKPVLTREKTIDIVRAFAVLLMIVTHVIAVAFDHKDESSRFIYYLGLVGGIVSFTFFLLLSGATNYLTFINLENTDRKTINLRKIKIFKKSLQILFAYYLLAALSLFINKEAFISTSSESWIKDIVRIILFLRIPEFTEFLLTLILFTLSLLFIRRIYKYIVSDFRIVVLVSLISYALGYILYNLQLAGEKFNLIKAILSGHENLHTFPLLQYLPIFLLGIYLGKIFTVGHSHGNDLQLQIRKILIILISLLGITIVSLAIFSQTDVNTFNLSPYTSRFPPTIGFIAMSLSMAFGFILFAKVFLDKLPSKIDTVAFYISKNALGFFIVHTIFILLFKYIQADKYENIDWRYSGILQIFGLYLLILFLTVLVLFLKNKLVQLYFYIDKHTNSHNFVVSYLIPTTVVVVFIGTIGLIFRDNAILRNQGKVLGSNDVSRVFNVDQNAEQWFDHNFKYYQKITIGELTDDQIFISKNWAKINFNHQESVQANNIRKNDGRDIRIVEDDGGEIKEIPIILKDPNSENTEVAFRFKKGADYYLYYANDTSEMSETVIDQSGIESAVKLELQTRTAHVIDATINKQWFLKDYIETPKLVFSVFPKEGLNIQHISYEVPNTEIKGNIEVSEGRVEFDVSNLQPGYYSIQATVVELTDQLTVYKSYKIPFFVSHPIYMVWSLDWEGWGVATSELNDIVDISTKYKMPITHFFNPRIYIKNQYSVYAVDENAASYFTYWILDRKNKGDEIGLHLHFYPDLLNEIGITVRSDAALVGISRDETYIQAYSKEELDKIIKWSLNKFSEKGLGVPVSFRSGAWMSSTTVLQVLSENGFLLDSSGRTGGILNPAWKGSTPIPWNLPATVKPFMPSVSNINAWDGQRIDIWEFADNGADSYWFSIDELKGRFDQNYQNKNEIAETPGVITYLSHPHGFTITDTSKIRGLLDYTGNFLYGDDNGPVVYSTLENIYLNWNKEVYYNGD